MKIGVPKEIKVHENRVGLVPESVRELVDRGHTVYVEHHAGMGIGCADAHYRRAGAVVLDSAQAVFEAADLIVKVKEPQPIECQRLREGQTLFTYLHLAPDPNQTRGLLDSGCTAIAYETVTDAHGRLPLLSPMSEVAGRLSIQVGAHCLEKHQGGRGVLLGGVPGVKPGHVVVIGGGVVGENAIRMAMGKGAYVTVLDRSLDRLRELDLHFGSRLHTLFSTRANVEESIASADLVIGAVLIAGRAAPQLVTRDMLAKMQNGSVIVDVSIDQGGCIETSRPTTHDAPTYVEEGVLHYSVANMPGAVPHTAAYALNNATLPFVIALAEKGVQPALLADPHLLSGLNIYQGHTTYLPVAEDLGLQYSDPRGLISGAKAIA